MLAVLLQNERHCHSRAILGEERVPGGTEAGKGTTTGFWDYLHLVKYCRKQPAFSVRASSLLMRRYRNLATV